MRRARPRERAVDGVLLLDKPPGITSHAAVQQARRLFQAARAGHTGTLDPLATGLLPVCLGEATKFAHLLLDAPKTYLATIRLGLTTRTGDLEGDVLRQSAVSCTEADLAATLARFVGRIEQVPPMYSAIKLAGQPLYKLARAGAEIERQPRSVVIYGLELLQRAGDDVTVRVCCSKGTYVRVLAEDIGQALGCGGCLASLRREAVGDFTLAGSITLERLAQCPVAERDAALLPADSLAVALPRVDLDEQSARRLGQGQSVECRQEGGRGHARVYGPGAQFLGIAEITPMGRLVPQRLMSRPMAAGGAHDGRRPHQNY